MITRSIFITVITLAFAAALPAQTSSFVYQGKLQDGGIAANGTYQFEFRLFDAAANGNQIGQTVSNVTATVTNGIFAVNLDFGAVSFDGSARYLDIAVRLNGTGQPYTPLNPRQPVTSTPYAVRSLNANTANTAINSANLGGIPAAQYVITTDPRMSDDRNPLPNSPNYIQNSTALQTLANFNINGTGKAAVIDVVTQYNIGGWRFLSAVGTENIFAGVGSGYTTTGGFNAFFGAQSGKVNTTGASNSFFGSYAGSSNTIGNSNNFFGVNSGGSNTEGSLNSFFGGASGYSNISGTNNSYFGASAGFSNTAASNNSMFGYNAGKQNSGGGNTFVGAFSGEKNTTGIFNSYLGLRAGKDTFTGSYNVYIGYETGAGNQGGSNNTYVGSKTGEGGDNNTLIGNSIIGGNGSNNTALGYQINIWDGVSNSTAIGYGATVQESNTIVLGTVDSKVRIPGNDGLYSFGSITTPSTLNAAIIKGNSLIVGGATISQISSPNTIQVGGVNAAGDGYFNNFVIGKSLALRILQPGGSDSICLGPVLPSQDRFLAQCSSSRRYKDNIETYTGGVEVLKRLRAVTFNWKSGGAKDIGFVAEEINEVEPLLNNYNEKGEVEGVKYAQVTTVLVNAVKEQQTQIERLEERIKKQNEQLELLKALICASNKDAAVCSEQGGRK